MALDHAKPGEIVPVGGPAAGGRTTALVKTEGFEAVRLVVAAGANIAPHAVPGWLTLHCLDGEAVVEAAEDLTMRTGDWLYLEPGALHGVRGVKDSALLLTILFPAA